MKAILVIDEMPKMCIGCPLNLADSSIKCRHTWTVKAIPSWCPLKPMPLRVASEQKMYVEDKVYMVSHEFTEWDKGWNACIDKIEGE